MKSRLLVPTLILFMACGGSTATAQTSTTNAGPTGDEAFYIVQDTTSKRCLITMTKPSGPTMTVLGGAETAFRSRADAETAMKEMNLCR